MSANLFTPTSSPYFLSHSIGLLPQSAKAHFDTHYFDPWSQGDDDIWPQWLKTIDEFCLAIATLLNTQAEQVCPQSNLSSGLTKFIGALPYPRPEKSTLLLAEQDFPSMGFVINQMSAFGFRHRFIPKELDLSCPQVWADYLTGDVAAAFITHVQSNTGSKIPFEKICKITRSRNIISIVDVAQSVGVIPIDLKTSDADCVLGSCVKWLCGGPGAGFIWIGADVLKQCKPLDVGWFSHKNPFEFDIHRFEYADTALRFWGGTPSVAPFIIAGHSVSVLLSIGIEKIAQHNRECKHHLRELLCDSLLVSPNAEEKQSGTVVLKNTAEFRAALDAIGLQYDTREHGIRLSPHIYTSMDDIEALAGCFLKR